MKKVLSVLLAVIMLVGVLAACGGTASSSAPSAPASTQPASTPDATSTPDTDVPSGEKIPIRFTYWNKEESMQALVDLINEKLPHIDFQFEFVDSASYTTVFNTQMAAGEGPDIFDVTPDVSGIDNGWALDLAGYDFVSRYTPSAIDELSQNGKVFSIPGPSWFGGYFYNKGMFEEHNWEVPKTYDEFIALCVEIQAAGIKPIANPIKNPNYLMHYALSYVTPAYLRTNAGMSWDKDYALGNVTMADTWLPYMEKWAEVVTQGYVTEQDLGMDAQKNI